MPSSATQVTSSSGATWSGIRLLVQRPSRSGVIGRSMTQGSWALRRIQIWLSLLMRLGEAVVEGPQRAAVVAPEVPGVADVLAQGRHVAGEDREVDVLVLARRTGEGLDRPAADDPPRPREAGHELRQPRRGRTVPSAPYRRKKALLLGLLLGSEGERFARRSHSSTRSSRCTTSRSYAAPSSRLRSCDERPSRAGSSAASKLTSPRATGSTVGIGEVDRVAGREGSLDPGDARPPAGTPGARPRRARRRRRGPGGHAGRWRGPATAAGSGGGGRWRGRACRPARRPARPRRWPPR